MTVDPLYIMLMMEAIVLLTALLIYIHVARRPKAEPPREEPREETAPPPPNPPAEPVPDPDLIRRSLILGMLEKNIHEVRKYSNLDEGGDKAESQGLLLDQVYDLNMDLLQNLKGALEQEDSDHVASLSDALTVKFRVSVNDRLLSFMRALERQTAAAPEAEPEAESEVPPEPSPEAEGKPSPTEEAEASPTDEGDAPQDPNTPQIPPTS
jgi:hypothetical protein